MEKLFSLFYNFIMISDEFAYLVLSIIEEIPVGCVATYGQIAQLAGRPNNSRLVGKILSMSEFYGKYPCHRVVNSTGRIAPSWKEQKSLLEAEGVTFKDSNHVNLKLFKWNC